MADSKLSALTAKTGMNLTDELLVNEAGTSKKIDFSDLTETGTFTPTIYGSTTAGTQTYTAQEGRYSRTGKMVQFDIFIQMSAKDGLTSGDIYIGGLPYASLYYSAISVSYLNNLTLTSGYSLQGFVQLSGTYIRLHESSGSARNTITDADISATTVLIVSGCYQAV